MQLQVDSGMASAGAKASAPLAAPEAICTPQKCRAGPTGCAACEISASMQQVMLWANIEHGQHDLSHAVCHAMHACLHALLPLLFGLAVTGWPERA